MIISTFTAYFSIYSSKFIFSYKIRNDLLRMMNEQSKQSHTKLGLPVDGPETRMSRASLTIGSPSSCYAQETRLSKHHVSDNTTLDNFFLVFLVSFTTKEQRSEKLSMNESS